MRILDLTLEHQQLEDIKVEMRKIREADQNKMNGNCGHVATLSEQDRNLCRIVEPK